MSSTVCCPFFHRPLLNLQLENVSLSPIFNYFFTKNGLHKTIFKKSKYVLSISLATLKDLLPGQRSNQLWSAFDFFSPSKCSRPVPPPPSDFNIWSFYTIEKVFFRRHREIDHRHFTNFATRVWAVFLRCIIYILQTTFFFLIFCSFQQS